jgi:hypothetical protein
MKKKFNLSITSIKAISGEVIVIKKVKKHIDKQINQSHDF